MILDLRQFLADERPFWAELEACLSGLERDPARRLSLPDCRRLHYLYQRASTDLAKVTTFSAEPETRRYLEALVARAYGEIHESRVRARGWDLRAWFLGVLPRVFRAHWRAFALSAGTTAVGAAIGALLIVFEPDARRVLMPFPHLRGDPAERVAREERQAGKSHGDPLRGHKSAFAAWLATHNTRVSLLCMALGVTWGLGTLVLLFSNGVILGAVLMDYVMAGETAFVFGWLLPHGAVEIPAILIAGQAGFVLAAAFIGSGERLTLAARLRRASPDVLTLVGGVAVLLVWAGFVEAFLSQYHEPVVPYAAKIGLGIAEIALLSLFLARAGRGAPSREVRRAD